MKGQQLYSFGMGMYCGVCAMIAAAYWRTDPFWAAPESQARSSGESSSPTPSETA